jgi:prepilin-type N-terminal cleavage/methylation domain-containing protein
MRARFGLTMLEVLVALVILGVIVTLYAQSSSISRKLSGRSTDWDQEGIAIEKTIENLRLRTDLARLRTIDSSWRDSTGQYAIDLTVKGATPTEGDCPGYPVQRLARVSILAHRRSQRDSVAVTTYVLVP